MQTGRGELRNRNGEIDPGFPDIDLERSDIRWTDHETQLRRLGADTPQERGHDEREGTHTHSPFADELYHNEGGNYDVGEDRNT